MLQAFLCCFCLSSVEVISYDDERGFAAGSGRFHLLSLLAQGLRNHSRVGLFSLFANAC